MEVAGLILLGGVAFFGASALIGRARITVFEYERGLWFRKWSFSSSARAGVYWHIPAFVRVQKIDVRVTRAAVTGQEVLTADGVPIKASVVGSYAVAQADRAILGADDYPQRRLQRTPACTPCGCDSDDIRRFARATIRALCALEKRSPPRDCGRSVSICSRRRFAILTFPGELKKIFTQLVKARQEGLAALEKARGETAALRNLANAAQMIERKPNLMQLRLLQVLAQQPGNTIVLGLQQSHTPIPVAGGNATRDLAAPDRSKRSNSRSRGVVSPAHQQRHDQPGSEPAQNNHPGGCGTANAAHSIARTAEHATTRRRLGRTSTLRRRVPRFHAHRPRCAHTARGAGCIPSLRNDMGILAGCPGFRRSAETVLQ